MTKQSRDPGRRDHGADARGPHQGRAVGRHARAAVSARLVVEALVAEAVARDAGPVPVTIDMPHTLAVGADEATLRGIFLPLVERSVQVTRGGLRGGDRRAEVTITAVEYPEAIEIEFADSGAGLDVQDLVALSPRARGGAAVGADAALVAVARKARAAGGNLTAVNCPDGGAALTVRLPTRATAALRRAA